MHTRRIRPSEYGVQLREKQKVKRIYGVYEKQFKNYYQKASSKQGVTGSNLLILLEKRLDNVIYRAGLANSRQQARQIVTHRHIKVNNRIVNIPSYQVRPGDKIELSAHGKKSQLLTELTQTKKTIPGWISLQAKDQVYEIVRDPSRDDVDLRIEEQLIVEFYSR